MICRWIMITPSTCFWVSTLKPSIKKLDLCIIYIQPDRYILIYQHLTYLFFIKDAFYVRLFPLSVDAVPLRLESLEMSSFKLLIVSIMNLHCENKLYFKESLLIWQNLILTFILNIVKTSIYFWCLIFFPHRVNLFPLIFDSRQRPAVHVCINKIEFID